LYPVLFRLGPVSVYSFGLLLALGFLLAVAVAFFNAKRHGIDKWLVLDMALFAFIAGLVGSRLLFVLLNWQLYADEPLKVFATWEGGVSFYGAIAGGFVVVVIFARRFKIRVGRLADTVAPGLALAASVGRLGCLLNGCCYGVPTSGFWGVFTRFAPGLRHPTQLYESVAYLLVFVFLLWWQKRHARAPGQVFLAFVGAYIVARFGVEFFREGERVYPWLSLTQAASIVIFLATVVIYIYLGYRAQAPVGLGHEQLLPAPAGEQAPPAPGAPPTGPADAPDVGAPGGAGAPGAESGAE